MEFANNMWFREEWPVPDERIWINHLFFSVAIWSANLRRRLGWSDEEQNAGHGDAWIVRRRIIHWGGTPVRNYDSIQIYTVYTSNKRTVLDSQTVINQFIFVLSFVLPFFLMAMAMALEMAMAMALEMALEMAMALAMALSMAMMAMMMMMMMMMTMTMTMINNNGILEYSSPNFAGKVPVVG